MKKTYINPEMITVHIASKMMIATSPGPDVLNNTDFDPNAGMDVKERTIISSNIWDDEW